MIKFAVKLSLQVCYLAMRVSYDSCGLTNWQHCVRCEDTNYRNLELR